MARVSVRFLLIATITILLGSSCWTEAYTEVPAVSLLPPDDQLFRALIVKFCADRQMAVDEAVVSYLATRIERSFAAARQAVELLDSEALRLGRPVTRALAAELLRNA